MNFDREQLSVLFWGLTLLVLTIVWLPAIISKMGGTRIRVQGPLKLPDPDPMLKEPDFNQWADRLRFQRYEILSAYSVQVDFVESSWRRTSFWRFFRSPNLPITAIMNKAPEPLNLWLTVELVTLLQNEFVLVSTNSLGQSPYDPERVLFESINTFDFAELERVHRERLEILKREGIRAEGDQSEEAVCEVLQRNLRESLLPQAKEASGKFLMLNLIIHASASLPFFYWLKPTHFAVPLINLAVASLLRFSELMERRVHREAAQAAMKAAIESNNMRNQVSVHEEPQ
jgi:hypothetical protein